LRVSTNDQTTDNQERELRAAAQRLGHYHYGSVSGPRH
jgi:DNA invertase Pin-like site-specific DNA recombinase